MKLCIGNLKFGDMEFGEMKRNTSNWSNFCILLRRAGLSASAGLSCLKLFLTNFSLVVLTFVVAHFIVYQDRNTSSDDDDVVQWRSQKFFTGGA